MSLRAPLRVERAVVVVVQRIRTGVREGVRSDALGCAQRCCCGAGEARQQWWDMAIGGVRVSNGTTRMTAFPLAPLWSGRMQPGSPRCARASRCAGERQLARQFS